MARRRRDWPYAVALPGQKAHVIVPSPARPACGVEIDMQHAIRYALVSTEVPAEDRCQASGCRGRWPAALRSVS